MPWKSGDAEGHTKKANTPKKQETWAKIANARLAACLKAGGEQDECEASAIKVANSLVSQIKEQEPGGPNKCVCPDCDYETDKERGTPCRSMKCPECDVDLVAGVEVEEINKMPITNVRQIATSAIETALAVVKGTGEITPERAERLLYALEADLGETTTQVPMADIATIEIGDEQVAMAELIAAYLTEQEQEKAVKAQKARSKRYGIQILGPPQGNRTKPSEYAGITDSDFSDPVNYKYPADAEHARAALGYFNRKGQREKGGYSTASWAKVGGRLAKLISKHLPAAYIYKDGKLAQKEEEQSEMEIENVSEIVSSLEDFANSVRDAFRVAFRPATVTTAEVPSDLWARDVLKDHPDLGDVLIIRDGGKLYAIEYSQGDDGLEFATKDNWVEVILTYVPMKGEVAELSESVSGAVIGLAEGETLQENGNRAPLLLDVALIEPGFGNKRDGHFYSAEMLKRDAQVFEGVKMYATDHKANEKSVRTEVSTIQNIVGFTDSGAPIARVAIHDPGFAEATRNRAQLGTLSSLECSILAKGRTRQDKIDGRKAKIVEAITSAQSVDWVSAAGAGGRALNLAESDEGGGQMSNEQKQATETTETEIEQVEETTLAEGEQEQEQEQVQTIVVKDVQEQEIQVLAESDVESALAETNLPQFVRIALASGEYETSEQLGEAITTAIAEVKKLTGSGQVFGQGATGPVEEMTLEEREQKRIDRFNKVMREIGAGEV